MPDFSQPLEQYLSRKPSWLREVASQGVHSTHEHLHTEAQRLARGPDTALWLHHYLPTDLAGAGVSPEVLQQMVQERDRPPYIPLRELDASIINAFSLVRHTGYGEVVKRTASLFGGSGELTVENLASCIAGLEQRLTPGFYARECGRCGLLSMQTNSFDMVDGERLPVRREQCHSFHFKDLFIDGFLRWPHAEMAQQEKSLRVDSLESWEALVERYFADDAADCIAVKCAMAYARSLNFEAVEREDASRALDAMLAPASATGSTASERRAFENYGMRFILALAGRYELPVKFHTGHYAGHGSEPLHRIRNNLIDLEPLIAAFPQVNFIIMHHAYPYGEAAVTLAKSYANCFIDQCWTWAMNPAAASRYLFEFLLGAPANKLFLFGGDYACLELTLGHLDLARQGLCLTLERLVDEGWATPDEALELARRVCHRNQEALFPPLRHLKQASP